MITFKKYFTTLSLIFISFLMPLSSISCDDEKSEYNIEDYLLKPGNDDDDTKLDLTIATFNIRVEGDVEDKAWSVRKEFAKKIIEKYGFDIFGVQEALSNQLNDLLTLQRYASIGIGRNGETSGEYSAILYNKDKFNVLESGTFWLSEDTTQPNKGWDAALPRICTWGKFQSKETEKEFYFFNTHFDHVGNIAREESAKLILQKMKDIVGDKPAFCTGDFNLTPEKSPMIMLSSSDYLFDSRAISIQNPTGPVGTFHGYNLNGTITSRIDYIFVTSTIQVEAYSTINDDVTTGKYSSDHFPVMAKVKL